MSKARVPLAIWLLPDPASAARLQPTLDRLADEWRAPRFAAHVTVHVADIDPGLDPEALVAPLLAHCAAIELRALPCEASPEYFRTLFLPLGPVARGRCGRADASASASANASADENTGANTGANTGIGQLRHGLVDALTRADAGGPDLATALAAYRLAPHLSLLYARIDDASRARLRACERTGPPGSSPGTGADMASGVLRFDRIALVRPAPGYSDLSQVANWQVGEGLRLAG